MIFLVAGAVVLVVIGALWARFAMGRSEQHSVKNYEHALGVLGGVAARKGGAAPKRPDVAAPHVTPAGSTPAAPTRALATPVARIDLPLPSGQADDVAEPSRSTARNSSPARPAPLRSAQVEPAQGSPPPVAITFDDLPDPVDPARTRRDRALRRAERPAMRRMLSITAALVVLGALGVGVFEVAALQKRSAAPAESSTTTSLAPATTTTVPLRIVPISVSSALVSYRVPSGRFTVSFATTGRCWIGIQREAAGPYLWDETLAPGATASYPTSGTVYVFIGAPGTVAVAVDGVPVVLPAHNVQPFRIALSPTA